MSIAKANKRKYKENYIKDDFTCLQKDGEVIPHCILCMKTLANSYSKTIPAQATFEQCSQGANQ